MKKTVLVAGAIFATLLSQQANAYSFEALYSLTNTTCTSSPIWDGCGNVGASRPGTLTLKVGEYSPGNGLSFAPSSWSFKDSYTGTIWDTTGGIGSNGSFTFYGYPSGYQSAALAFDFSGIVPDTNAPSSLVPNMMLGSFSATFGHSLWYGTLQSDVTLIAFRETGTLSPIPEPETYGMLLAGLGGIGYVARRRKNKLL